MTIESFIKKHSWWYKNPNLTTKNFPKQKIPAGEPQLITLDKYMSGGDAIMAMLKEKGLRAANVYEMMEYIDAHLDDLKGSDKWFPAFGSLWTDSGGCHRVPFVGATSRGDWVFNLGYFEDGWLDGFVLLVFSDESSGSKTASTSSSKPKTSLESLPLELPAELEINGVMYKRV